MQSGVSRIHNEYVTSTELFQKIIKKRRRGLIRRLLAFFILFALVVGSLYSVIRTQHQQLEAVHQQKLQKSKQLVAATTQMKTLQHQIQLLHNNDYIGELARQNYFMSKKGEIIFASSKNSEH